MWSSDRDEQVSGVRSWNLGLLYETKLNENSDLKCGSCASEVSLHALVHKSFPSSDILRFLFQSSPAVGPISPPALPDSDLPIWYKRSSKAGQVWRLQGRTVHYCVAKSGVRCSGWRSCIGLKLCEEEEERDERTWSVDHKGQVQ